MNTLARVISYLFHPLLVPTYLFYLLAKTYPPALDPVQSQSHMLFIILIFMVTFALPVINLFILKMFKAVRSLQMVNRRERIIPFFFVTIIYGFITYLFYTKSRIAFNDNFMKLMLIIDLLVLVSTIITLFYKISIHSLVMWGVIGVMIPLNKMTEVNALFYPTLIIIVLTGFVMSARIQLNVHTPKEVIWGGVAGLASSIAGMLVLYPY